MKAIAFHLQKGGVGKTTLSGAVAYELAQRGKTILVDIDPQGNATSWHLSENPKHELADVLQGKVTAAEAITPTACPTLDLLPTFGLDGELKLYGETQLTNEPFIFCDLAEELAKLGYQFAIFDLSPGIGRLEKSALIACSEVVTPMTPEFFGLDGLEIFSNELARLRKAMRKAPEHRKIIVNAYDGRIEQHREVGERVGKLPFEVFRLPVDPAFRKAQSRNIPVQMLSKDMAAKTETLSTLKNLAEGL